MKRTLLLLLISALGLRADGVADLRAALSRLQGTTALKGTLEVKRWNRNGEGKEAIERAGHATAWVEDGPQGLRMFWDRTLLGQVGQEARAIRKDPNAKNPATTGLGALSPKLVTEQINAAEAVAGQLEHAHFQAETRETWQGRSARMLTFVLTTKGLSDRDRKYVKDFSGTAQIWIDEDGTPLASTTKVSLKGRAFLVVSFNQEQEESSAFQKVGDRLVCVRTELTSTGSGAGEKGKTHNVTTFAIQ